MEKQDEKLERTITLDLYKGASLVVQWLRLQAPNAGGPGSIPEHGTRSYMPQVRVTMPQIKILHTAAKTSTAK